MWSLNVERGEGGMLKTLNLTAAVGKVLPAFCWERRGREETYSQCTGKASRVNIKAAFPTISVFAWVKNKRAPIVSTVMT
jgi:hypothetical protein